MATLTTDIAFPSALPLPFLNYAGGFRNATLFADEDAAVIINRSRFTRAYGEISVTWKLVPGKYEAFREFVENTLGNGVAAFSIELRYPKNTALTEWQVRILEPVVYTWNVGVWDAETTLDLISPTTIADAAEQISVEGYFVLTGDTDEAYEPYYTSDGELYNVKT